MRLASTLPGPLLFLLSLLSMAGSVGCTTNPATGRMMFNTLSTEEELSIGAEAAPDFIAQNGGLVPDEALQAYVAGIGERLAAVSERPDLPWEFFLLDSAQINAFALPGGKVFMSRGLMEKMNSEAQLAGVLGHEVGHVTAHHIGQRLSRAKAVTIGGALLSVIGVASENDWLTAGGTAVSLGGGLYLVQFSKKQETESDALGVRYMAKLGYNPYGQVRVMEILKEAAGEEAGGLKAFLSTHPLPSDRIEDLEALIAEDYPDADQPGRYEEHRERFRRQGLVPLSRLPPPAHPGRQAPTGDRTQEER